MGKSECGSFLWEKCGRKKSHVGVLRNHKIQRSWRFVGKRDFLSGVGNSPKITFTKITKFRSPTFPRFCGKHPLPRNHTTPTKLPHQFFGETPTSPKSHDSHKMTFPPTFLWETPNSPKSHAAPTEYFPPLSHVYVGSNLASRHYFCCVK